MNLVPGPPVLLADSTLADPRQEFILAHELGHQWLPPRESSESELAEALATWVSGWSPDTDGGPASRYWVPRDGPPRCPILVGRPAPGDDAALLLTGLEDRMGRAALLERVTARRTDDWAELLEALPRADADWLRPWLVADRWPVLVAQVDGEDLRVVDEADTALPGVVEVALTTPSGPRTVAAPFGPEADAVRVPAGSAVVAVDPRARLPVVADRS